MLCSALCSARDYRIDTQEAFEAINYVVLRPGDAVLLKRGMQFYGMLAPSGSGTERLPSGLAPTETGNALASTRRGRRSPACC